jgi:2-isopropylmalate synthase
MDPNRVYIFDTTLRDGEQSPGCRMNTPEKLRMARQIVELGADILEAGFPIASQDDHDAVRAIAREYGGSSIAALARCSQLDIERAGSALEPAKRPRIHIFIATSDIHLKHKLHRTREQALEDTIRCVELARRYADDVEFSAEDATRSDFEYLCQVLEAAVEGGCSTINVPDTVGYSYPDEYGRFIAAICERLRGRAIVSVHCHNDLGLAVANTLAAIEAGARQVEVTINGIGERAGNAALEEVVMALKVRQDRLPYSTGIRTELLYPASQLLTRTIGVAVQPNKAIVGNNAFAHEAGIHQDGVLKNRLCYEIMTPQSVGIPQTQMVLGKHSGRHALRDRYEHLGYHLEKQELDEIYQRFTQLADRKKNILDDDLIELMEHSADESVAAFSLDGVEVAMNGASRAVVRLLRQGKHFQGEAEAEDAIIACCRAVGAASGHPVDVRTYAACLDESTCLNKVDVTLSVGGQHYSGQDEAGDAVSAATGACLKAVNKFVRNRGSQVRRPPASERADPAEATGD